MNILILGSGGREHALAWKIRQSPLCNQLFIAPGNAGTASCGTNVDLPLDKDFPALERFCREQSIHLVVVGPEDPLVNGVYDYFEAAAAREPFAEGWVGVFGPSREAAQLEGSKAFAKQFMQRHGIPTAAYREFTTDTLEEGKAYLAQHRLPVVLKADGLAAGKGVLICTSREEAIAELEAMLAHAKFGAAGAKVVVEEFLSGIELSMFVITDGRSYVLLPEAKDYKRIGEGDTGLNTGGMGAVSPVPFADAVFLQKVTDRIIRPTIRGLEAEGLVYKGFVFFGLISVNGEPFVIEYNCRMGDPETEVVLPRLATDLVPLLRDALLGTLQQGVAPADLRAAVTVVAVSGGYPGAYEKGFPITGLEQEPADTTVFHAGTREVGGAVLTNGGRVLAVTSRSHRLAAAAEAARRLLTQIRFRGMYYRGDIGYEFPEN
ncbi:MAG TPA: phosphoribosylamine--glycine ligase [Lacibacter sp.]|nr:phosphoribosylamine--glycine ligase [Lacibacter sp.]HMO88738.1 phosphoribosylamine--glycine ligase [Lacibacter sp.]HMP85982.1 phosphoribosylamine--glycine ligase [Lacibacter sp.]